MRKPLIPPRYSDEALQAEMATPQVSAIVADPGPARVVGRPRGFACMHVYATRSVICIARLHNA